MEFFKLLFHLLFGGLNDPAKWNAVIQYVGQGNIYLVLFAIIFAETGLVVTPFLPGDSLLFAIGAIGMKHEIALNLPLVTGLLMVAAILGDAVNYWIGYKMGPAVFTREDSKLLNKKHLLRAQEFYEKYGGKTIILARFVPVVRTFAPFVAGVGKMNFFRFWMFNIIGGIGWVLLCVLAGMFFGQFEFVKKHFEMVIIAVVIISILPMVFEYYNARRRAKAAMNAVAPAGEKA
jgi:membrane-associated protein